MSDELDNNSIKALLAGLVPELRAKRKRLAPVVQQLKAEKRVFAPKGQTTEHRYLEELTHSPWGSKVATTYAQELSVSGFLSPDSEPGDNDPAWAQWAKARMPLIEDVLIRESFEYGESFAAVVPSATGGQAVVKPLHPVHTVASYADPVTDVWPVAVLTTVADKKTASPIPGTLYVADWVYVLSFPDGLDESSVRVADAWQHKSDVTPVVRFLNEIDSLGNTVGKIAPLLQLLNRIRKDTYDRVLIQHKSSWKVRTATGLAEPEDGGTDSREQTKLRLGVEDVLVSSEPNAKFGTLDETPLDNLINAKEADIYELASLAPVPPSALMPGKMANIAAEAIAELRNGFENRVADHKEILGEAFGWLIRMLATQAGVAASETAATSWYDRSVRSLAQAADAWSKAVPGLNIPAEGVWDRLPGVTQNDIARWKNLAKKAQGNQALAAIFTRQSLAPAEPAA